MLCRPAPAELAEARQPEASLHDCALSQVLDAYLRNRAKENGAKVYNGLFLRSSQKDGPEGAFTVNFSDYSDGGKVCWQMTDMALCN